ncbi:MAG: hypothetical protein CW346_14355, partial [Bacillaceae bacterium]|nr:hypothetical protein [Bacillaceae bacterium]
MPSGKPRLFFKSSFGFLPEKRELTSRSGSGNICRDTGQATRNFEPSSGEACAARLEIVSKRGRGIDPMPACAAVPRNRFQQMDGAG